MRPFKKMPRSLLSWAQTGWFSFLFQSGHHPGLAKADASRILFDARPPLLAAVRGGEFGHIEGRFQFFHRRYRARSRDERI